MLGFDENLIDDLKVKYTQVSLSNRYHYITKYVVQNTQIVMRCGYNTRNKSRWVFLLDIEGDIILSQTFLKFGRRCELNFNANLNNLNHYITLKPKDPSKVFLDSYDYSNWADDFDICFVGYEKVLEDRLQDNIRKIYAGN